MYFFTSDYFVIFMVVRLFTIVFTVTGKNKQDEGFDCEFCSNVGPSE
jgi:hypothetical protein